MPIMLACVALALSAIHPFDPVLVPRPALCAIQLWDVSKVNANANMFATGVKLYLSYGPGVVRTNTLHCSVNSSTPFVGSAVCDFVCV